MAKCLGPEASAVMKGRLISVSSTLRSSILAFSAASFSRCRAMRSLRQIDALVLLEFRDNPVHHALVDVVAAQVRVAVGGLHFHHAFAHFQDGNVEGAAAEVVDGNGFVLLLVKPVGQRRGRGLIHDAQNFETRDFAGIFGRLALASLKYAGTVMTAWVTFSPR